MSVDDGAYIDELDGYISTGRAARLLDVNEARVRQLMMRGELERKLWDGRTPMIAKASLVAYQERRARERRGKPGPARGHGGRPTQKNDGQQG